MDVGEHRLIGRPMLNYFSVWNFDFISEVVCFSLQRFQICKISSTNQLQNSKRSQVLINSKIQKTELPWSECLEFFFFRLFPSGVATADFPCPVGIVFLISEVVFSLSNIFKDAKDLSIQINSKIYKAIRSNEFKMIKSYSN